MRLLLLALLVMGCGEKTVRGPSGPPPDPPIDAAPVVVDPPPPTLRLGEEVRLVAGALDLTIDPAQPTFSGVARYTAQVTTRVPVVWVNATDLTFTSATLNGAPARVVAGNADFTGLALPTAIEAGPLAIEIAFTGLIDHQRAQGLYAEAEGGLDYAYTFFEPLDARRAFPCFDQPDAKIPWTLTFHVKQDHVALGNAPVAREVPETNGMKRVELVESKPMPSYLVAYIVGPFEITDGGVAGKLNTPVRFIAPRGRAAELRYAKEVTPKVVAALETYTGIDYPFVKLDVAVPPRYWGTMEHPGLLAMGQPLTLIKPAEETRDRKLAYVNILAHELAHYWFGDLVTMKWWDDTWLNESLGTWMDGLITHAVEPAWNFDFTAAERAHQAMAADERVAVRAIRNPIETRDDILASFDASTTYFKGEAVIRMFERFVGPAQWQAFIRAYLTKFAWKNAHAQDFFDVMLDVLGPNVTQGFRDFVDQPGLPLVHYKWTCNERNMALFELGQMRSLPGGKGDNYVRAWDAPVCFRYGKGKTTREQCGGISARTRRRETLLLLQDMCPTWVAPNPGSAGYYRVYYAEVNLGLLLGRASPATPIERAYLLAGMGSALSRKELTIADAMALAPKVLADRDDRIPARFTSLTAGLDPRLFDDADYQRYRAWLRKLTGPTARKLGWRRRPGDSDDRHAKRLALVSTAAGTGDTRLAAEALALTKQWLADPSSVPDDTAGVALAVSAVTADAALFDALLAAAKTTPDVGTRQRLLVALGLVEDPALAQRALELVLAGELPLTDTIDVVATMLTRRGTSELAWTWLKAHRDEVVVKMRADELAFTVLATTGSAFCDATHRAEVEATFMPLTDHVEGAGYALANALEQIQDCIDLQVFLAPAAKAYLAKRT